MPKNFARELLVDTNQLSDGGATRPLPKDWGRGGTPTETQ